MVCRLRISGSLGFLERLLHWRINMIKYCVDCKYFVDGRFGNWCESHYREIDIVTGKAKATFAHQCRKEHHLCGPEAKWFEPLQKTKVKFWRKWLTL